jgi:hypothetical protein
MQLTDYHAKYFAYELTKRVSSDRLEKFAGALVDAQVDLNPHQVEAALIAFELPLSKGALLADEVGLGKTIEAGLVLSQKWAERKRCILIITPANLRKQWLQEIQEKFFLANRPDTPIRLQRIVLDPEELRRAPVTVISQPNLETQLGLQPQQVTTGTQLPPQAPQSVFAQPQEQDVAQLAYAAMRSLSRQPQVVPSVDYLQRPEVQARVIEEVTAQYGGGVRETRLEDYIVGALVDFDDIAYDQNADLLYDLAAQVVRHLSVYLGEEQIHRVLRVHQKDLARLIRLQMHEHAWEEDVAYDTKVSQGFVDLRPSAFSAVRDELPLDFRHAPADKSNMARYLFGGFARCLYPVLKFQSDAERRLAVILERDAQKWFKPARSQFQIYYKDGPDQKEYVPDFVAEDAKGIYMLEPKASDEVEDKQVLAKRAAAEKWCALASNHAATYGGKRWTYAVIPHTTINDSMSLPWLVDRYRTQ